MPPRARLPRTRGAPASEPRPRARPGTAVLAVVLGVLLVASALLAIGLGSAVVHPADTVRYLWAALSGGTIAAQDVTHYQIVWQIRTPRVLLAVLVGAGLGTVGVAVQSLVRNALADPFVLGISSGGAVGAVAVSTAGALTTFGIYATSVGAFLGAMAATVLVFAVAYSRAGTTPLRLVLTGVALSFGFQAVMSVLIYLVPGNEATSTLLFWSMGSFGAATWGVLPAVAAVVLAGSIVLHRFARTLDVMSLGDEAAVSMGVDPAHHRHLLFGITAVMTGAMVAASGAIGFAGLVVPHVTRMLVGARHARVLVLAPVLGAVLMVWVDLLARTLVAPRELPVGVLTALLGVPVFLMLMRRRQYVFGGTS